MSRAQARAITQAFDAASVGGTTITAGSDASFPVTLFIHANSSVTEEIIAVSGPISVYGFYLGNRTSSVQVVDLRDGADVKWQGILQDSEFLSAIFNPPLAFATDPVFRKSNTSNVRYTLVYV